MACNSCIPYVIAFYVLLLAFVAAVLSVYKLSSRGAVDGSEAEEARRDAATVFSWLMTLFSEALDQYGFPFGRVLITFFYEVYRRLSWLNVFIVVLKYVPTGLYMYKTLKNIYLASQERIKKRQMELDDLQLRIQIINTKLCVRDAEFTERTEHLRHKAERLRSLRARVRGMIDTDVTLQCALQTAAGPAPEQNADQTSFTPKEEREFIMELLKELKKGEQFTISEQAEKIARGGEQSAGDADDEPESVYSSLSDGDAKECRIKIVKVTNVYRVACLKHYIKQKRLRRLTQQAMLKKKIESIKKLLESWQKSLNAVIYNRISRDPISVELASQEAMGDYSKVNLREFSDSDTELRASCTDFDEYNLNWMEASNNYEAMENSASPEKEIYESPEYQMSQMSMNYQHTHGTLHTPMCECSGASESMLFILPEETSSQVAIEEVDTECRVMVSA